ncbi:UDP-3-O-(3-hydroxymyristoyl)glucosamine N-acyltransferase [Maridesulfovibrio hydrothermalis]|uniref:UDP-3-O-[3-hydroxymyristoyl] glucosamine N-acyltransferase n=1 Tax=Maridesulfovibrio hydrothermalis AM13 = DSM 14728 TaxID=1121451 RepID=L0RAL9_9BACT|nr:UDP-3-O-(3-hydroxymyristoyl)glucosamine N-acyltransferase [Maridesulfovibrio hydrothermalis]CCO23235.1 UDP-3-O-[3-hydroxymyristoyl] glucosamine N-acyltransferase [Maridesulfovibrio hydrothermalis AM13 = DSM 14728]
MFRSKENHLYSSEIAHYLGLDIAGKNVPVNFPCHFKTMKENGFTFIPPTEVEEVKKLKNVLLFCPEDYDISINSDVAFIPCANPKIAFYRIVNEFFIEQLPHSIANSAKIAETAQIGINVNVGEHAVIIGDVTVGNNTFIGNNVTILGKTTIGSGCVIKDNAVIGSEGFSFLEVENELMHVPQIGSIKIGNDVWIGSGSSIERPSLGITVLENGAKIDDLAQVGHEVRIGANTQVAAGTVFSGRVTVGKDCFIGVNVSVRPDVSIGDNVLVGIGSVVTKDLPGDAVYAGVPARPFSKK